MQRSGSQKYLFVVSVIDLVFSGIVIALSLGAIFVGMGGGAGGAVFGIAGVIGIAMSLLDVLRGVLGIRAANDAQKIMPVWVLAIIDLVFAAFTVIMAIVNGSIGQDLWQVVVEVAISVFTFWIANNIKTQAGK